MAFEDMDIKKLRIIVITALVLFFVGCLILIKIGAEKMGISGGEPPLLKLIEESKIIQGTNIKALNDNLGKEVTVRDTVEDIKTQNGTWILKLHYLSVPVRGNVLSAFKQNYKPSKLKGKTVEVTGTIKIVPKIGLSIVPKRARDIKVLD